MKLPTETELLQQLVKEACEELSAHARYQRMVRLAWDALIAFLIVSLIVWVCT